MAKIPEFQQAQLREAGVGAPQMDNSGAMLANSILGNSEELANSVNSAAGQQLASLGSLIGHGVNAINAHNARVNYAAKQAQAKADAADAAQRKIASDSLADMNSSNFKSVTDREGKIFMAKVPYNDDTPETATKLSDQLDAVRTNYEKDPANGFMDDQGNVLDSAALNRFRVKAAADKNTQLEKLNTIQAAAYKNQGIVNLDKASAVMTSNVGNYKGDPDQIVPTLNAYIQDNHQTALAYHGTEGTKYLHGNVEQAVVNSWANGIVDATDRDQSLKLSDGDKSKALVLEKQKLETQLSFIRNPAYSKPDKEDSVPLVDPTKQAQAVKHVQELLKANAVEIDQTQNKAYQRTASIYRGNAVTARRSADNGDLVSANKFLHDTYNEIEGIKAQPQDAHTGTLIGQLEANIKDVQHGISNYNAVKEKQLKTDDKLIAQKALDVQLNPDSAAKVAAVVKYKGLLPSIQNITGSIEDFDAITKHDVANENAFRSGAYGDPNKQQAWKRYETEKGLNDARLQAATDADKLSHKQNPVSLLDVRTWFQNKTADVKTAPLADTDLKALNPHNDPHLNTLAESQFHEKYNNDVQDFVKKYGTDPKYRKQFIQGSLTHDANSLTPEAAEGIRKSSLAEFKIGFLKTYQVTTAPMPHFTAAKGGKGQPPPPPGTPAYNPKDFPAIMPTGKKPPDKFVEPPAPVPMETPPMPPGVPE